MTPAARLHGNETLLEVDNLRVHFHSARGVARAVDGVSFRVRRGETFGLVGESGCGKTVTALSVMRLVPTPPGRIVGGRVMLNGQDLHGLPESSLRRIRGDRIGMVFQEPMGALNPVFTVGQQVTEVLRRHRDVSRRQAAELAVQMLERVRIPEPARRMTEYPHQLSGGMQQRVVIAMALACGPDLLIADEPTTALDVTTQARILELLRELQRELAMSVLLITHDLGVIAEAADRVGVMYGGRIVECAGVNAIFHDPQHPYMAGLLRSLPGRQRGGHPLPAIAGSVPSPLAYPSGCRFHPRCSLAVRACAETRPQLRKVQPGHGAACIRLPGYWREGEALPAGLEPPDPRAAHAR